MAGRKHLAQRWYSPDGVTLRCRQGDFEVASTSHSLDGLAGAERAFRDHRRAMGELVKPEGERSVRMEFTLSAPDVARLDELRGELTRNRYAQAAVRLMITAGVTLLCGLSGTGCWTAAIACWSIRCASWAGTRMAAPSYFWMGTARCCAGTATRSRDSGGRHAELYR